MGLCQGFSNVRVHQNLLELILLDPTLRVSDSVVVITSSQADGAVPGTTLRDWPRQSFANFNVGKKSLGDLVKRQILIRWVWTGASDSVFPGQASRCWARDQALSTKGLRLVPKQMLFLKSCDKLSER